MWIWIMANYTTLEADMFGLALLFCRPLLIFCTLVLKIPVLQVVPTVGLVFPSAALIFWSDKMRVVELKDIT